MYVPQKLVSNHSRLFRWKFLIGSALLCFPLAYCIVQISILKLLDSLRRLDLQMWCWIFSLWFSMMSPINNVLLCSCFLFCSSLSHENVQIFYRIFSAKLSFNSFTVVPMEVSYKRSAALLFACFLYCSSLNIETLFEFRKTTLANVMLNFFSLVLNDVFYKHCAALLWRSLFGWSLSHEKFQSFCRICMFRKS